MDINLTLVSTKKTLLISFPGIFIILIMAFYFFILRSFHPFLFLVVIIVGGLIIYFLLKNYARFVDTVYVNQDYLRVGDKFTIHWDNVNSYQYSNTGLLVGFVFRSIDKTYRITGLTKGREGEKFKLISNSIFKILEERESLPKKNKILVYDFNTTKKGRRSNFITLAICLVSISIVLYALIIYKSITTQTILGLAVLVWTTFLLIRRIYIYRK